MRIDAGLAIRDLGIKDFVLYGNPVDETEFLRMFKKIIGKDQNKHAIVSHNPNDFGVTWQQIQAKIAELQAAEPLRLLRIERDRLLQQTDWEIQRNTERNIDSTELITYRNALRDLPQDISANNVPSPTLSETGELLFAHWPNRYEINIENTQTANNSANTV